MVRKEMVRKEMVRKEMVRKEMVRKCWSRFFARRLNVACHAVTGRLHG
jgi:hypothetical protein